MATPSHSRADELFQAECLARGFQPLGNGNGGYVVQIGGVRVDIDLANLRSQFQAEQDPSVITRFVEHVISAASSGLPSWDAVAPLLRYSVEPAEVVRGGSDCLAEQITPAMSRVYVYRQINGVNLHWINPSMVEAWGVSLNDIMKRAHANMDDLMSTTDLEIHLIDDVPLGLLPVSEPDLKAALLLSSRLRSRVESALGWPVYAVAPARDFVYLLRAADREFLGRLGAVVMREFSSAGYPVTAEALEISDSGVVAIGTFARQPS